MAAAALSYCMEQVRRYDNDRFLCNLFAPPAEREALAALCAFNLELAHIREAVREPLLGHMRLRWWSEMLDAVWDGRKPAHRVGEALADARQRFGLGRSQLDRMLAARALDLDERPPASLAALAAYARDTSGALAEAGLPILGVDSADAETAAAAREVGTAWALIGLVRAVPFHARSRRLYLPADVASEAGLDAARLFDHRITDGVASACARVVDVAREHLRRARSRRSSVSLRALPVLLPATLADRYVTRLERTGFDPFVDARARPAPLKGLTPAWARMRRRF